LEALAPLSAKLLLGWSFKIEIGGWINLKEEDVKNMEDASFIISLRICLSPSLQVLVHRSCVV
jgi:hypothetical protein